MSPFFPSLSLSSLPPFSFIQFLRILSVVSATFISCRPSSCILSSLPFPWSFVLPPPPILCLSLYLPFLLLFVTLLLRVPSPPYSFLPIYLFSPYLFFFLFWLPSSSSLFANFQHSSTSSEFSTSHHSFPPASTFHSFSLSLLCPLAFPLSFSTPPGLLILFPPPCCPRLFILHLPCLFSLSPSFYFASSTLPPFPPHLLTFSPFRLFPSFTFPSFPSLLLALLCFPRPITSSLERACVS